ncbi:MAG: hypothetical protein IJ364_03805 [Oscillospiraceae bacterium]|nr:hypothetical protein [Oscillospiraceae bacterium]
MKKKMFSILFSLALILSFPVCALAEQEELTESAPVVEISISSAEQFVSFSENCIIDSYSENLLISLENSIDLRGYDFDAVPIFCGTFDGKGNTISGLDITDNGSVQGLFRYLTEGACVKNLNVNGNVTPGGSHSQIGGIAGNNSGSIINCKFSGKLNGSSFV